MTGLLEGAAAATLIAALILPHMSSGGGEAPDGLNWLASKNIPLVTALFGADGQGEVPAGAHPTTGSPCVSWALARLPEKTRNMRDRESSARTSLDKPPLRVM
ncbi:MAG: hypothetical protein ACLPOO_15070 [Terriglobales bacterium]